MKGSKWLLHRHMATDEGGGVPSRLSEYVREYVKREFSAWMGGWVVHHWDEGEGGGFEDYERWGAR